MGVKPDMQMVRRAINKIGEDIFDKYLDVRLADILSQSDYMRQDKLDNLNEWKALYHRVLEENQCVSMKNLAISGSDLIAAGMKPGKEMGEVLRRLFDLVLENPSLNTKDALLDEYVKMKSD